LEKQQNDEIHRKGKLLRKRGRKQVRELNQNRGELEDACMLRLKQKIKASGKEDVVEQRISRHKRKLENSHGKRKKEGERNSRTGTHETVTAGAFRSQKSLRKKEKVWIK